MPNKRVAIVGAGASGLPAIRHAILYGIEPVCFECTEHLGGLWRYTEGGTNVHGQELSCVMKSTVINTSKEMTAFSDFPPPAEYANFMHNSKLYDYFKQYAEYFELKNISNLIIGLKMLKELQIMIKLENGRLIILNLMAKKILKFLMVFLLQPDIMLYHIILQNGQVKINIREK
jgi:hypothetical protein